MKKLSLAVIMGMLVSLSSCEIIGGIFKAGVWVGILIVVAIVVGIIFMIGKAGGK